ncbi:MAG: tryptophanase [Bacillota bacterium]
MESPLTAEPYRIKMVEPLHLTTLAERRRCISEAGYNPFLLESRSVYIDLLTDSGTGSMSDSQWAAMMEGDESYAGSRSFQRLRQAVADVMGFSFVIPAHQGRAAENILFLTLLKEGDLVPSNYHFDTTRAHVWNRRAVPVDLVSAEAHDPELEMPFKGDVDLARLDDLLREKGPGKVPLVMVTLTCNGTGGHPVSMANLKGLRDITLKYGVPLVMDACRFAENAYFIKTREPGYQDKPVAGIVREMMDQVDGCTMSAKKDALANIGGFLALRDPEIVQRAQAWAVLYEGFPTYGGMAGRDMEAVARGLREVLDFSYLADRVGQVQYLHSQLVKAGVPVVKPSGGHAVYVDAGAFLPHLPRAAFPAWALSVELYLEAGVRGVEIGSVMAGRDPRTGENMEPRLEMVRLAIPRRTYTYRHMDVVARAFLDLLARRERVKGYRFEYEPPVLRHFTARLSPM